MYTDSEKEFIIPVTLYNFEHGTIYFKRLYRNLQ